MVTNLNPFWIIHAKFIKIAESAEVCVKTS